MKARPKLVYADKDGNIFDHPTLEMGATSGRELTIPQAADLIPLPQDSRLFTMPGRIPMGWHSGRGRFTAFDGGKRKGKGRSAKSFGAYCAVAAFPPPGYTRTLLPATRLVDSSQLLPLWAYTAVGWKDGRFWVAAKQVDSNPHWVPANFDDREITPKVEERLQAFPENRLLEHLSRCAIDYHCFAAKNAFLRRWELPIPTAPGCNSRCVGCLSWQPPASHPSSHERITFAPTVKEIVEVSVPHLMEVKKGLISFGQGCEGDPILQADLIEETIRAIRAETDAGSINMNTNASRPKDIQRLCEAGLNSIRISMNSAIEETYNRYYRPVNYTFNDLVTSAKIAKDHQLFVSINLLTFPGVTDRISERDALLRFIEQTQIDFIQMRNLSIDPDIYLDVLGLEDEQTVGIQQFMERIRLEFPHIGLGYFNRPKEDYSTRGKGISRPRGAVSQGRMSYS